MSDDVLRGGDDGPPPKRTHYCPECGSESSLVDDGTRIYHRCPNCRTATVDLDEDEARRLGWMIRHSEKLKDGEG